jgi:hypothetical protein
VTRKTSPDPLPSSNFVRGCRFYLVRSISCVIAKMKKCNNINMCIAILGGIFSSKFFHQRLMSINTKLLYMSLSA